MNLATFRNPGREFTPIPLWFWNDELREEELARQIADFEAHGVYGFAIHVRIGVPHDFGWMSDRMMDLVRFAVEEARRREMTVVFMDEGMYPSGSSCGQVVAANPEHRVRCLAHVRLAAEQALPLKPGENLVAVVERRGGELIAVVDRQAHGVIRGIHYVGEGPREVLPPAADILNPAAVASFIRLVYDRLAECVGDHFGKTVIGIFTDEPDLLGRPADASTRAQERPGTTGILEHVGAYLGYDFTPRLPALWYDDEPDAARYRRDYGRAVRHRLLDTYYRPLHDWCAAHGLALMGHPAGPDEIGAERFFHIPGQDVIARKILPGVSAIEGSESAQAKCASSAMIHLGRRRNSNECFGNYGHELTYDEMKFVTDWLFVRGANMLMPHAFYYSMRGCRRDERPPDVGPNSPWWDNYKAYADYCRRMSWLNADSQHVCDIAILGTEDCLPWAAARVCLERQRDFNYLEMRHLHEDAVVDADGIRIASMRYAALVIDGITEIPDAARAPLDALCRAGRVIVWRETTPDLELDGATLAASAAELAAALDGPAAPDLTTTARVPDLRCRHTIKDGRHFYFLFNEGTGSISCDIEVAATGVGSWLDPFSCEARQILGAARLELAPFATTLLRVIPDAQSEL